MQVNFISGVPCQELPEGTSEIANTEVHPVHYTLQYRNKTGAYVIFSLMFGFPAHELCNFDKQASLDKVHPQEQSNGCLWCLHVAKKTSVCV